MDKTSLAGRGRPTNTAGITNELAPLSKADQKLVSAANSILNSKEFEVIKKAFKEGKEVTVNIGGKPIQYDPNWTYIESMTNHEAGGFFYRT